MQEIYIEDIGKVLKNKKFLEKEFLVKISNRGKNVFFEGKPNNEFVAMNVLRALDLGFSSEQVLLLKDPEFIFYEMNIKDLTNRKDFLVIRGRIIGRGGRTLQTLSNLSNCEIELKDNDIGIIGSSDSIECGIQAITSIVQGSKQGNVYARLEKQNKRRKIYDKTHITDESLK